MLAKLNDLLFVIGLFLSLIGLIVLATSILGPSDVVHGIRVNLMGGSALSVIGIAMIVGSFVRDRKA